MDKQKIIQGVVLLIVGFGLGAYLTFHTKELFIKQAIVQAPVIEKPAENKLFSFFDAFTANKDMGTARIEFMYPEAHLLLVVYPTSQETVSYLIYNYKDNIMYDNVGIGLYVAGGDTPIAFVGTDKLLVRSDIEADIKGNTHTVVTIRDFKGNVIKELLKDIVIREVYPKYGDLIYISTGTDPKKTKTYILNTTTLELTEQGPLKG